MTNPPRRAANLPPIHRAAWHGPIGETAAALAPTTEADPVAVLGTLLALFGALATDASFVRVGGVRHPPRIWPLVIGKTGSGRKGTSMATARAAARLWSPYADGYLRARVVSGLASGEGLISALGGAVGVAGEAEATAPDGKLTVVESEFARVLAAARREGSTLGPILRQLWDDGHASILTRAAPLTVSHAHLAVIAHITPRELRLRLGEADLVGGTLNRFLLLASERPHLLPHDPDVPDLVDQAEALGKAVERARLTQGEIHRDREADALWPDVYAALCQEEPDGNLGAVLARGPAYTMRLALVYALADRSGVITVRHLLAGLAVWQYAAATAHLLFPDAYRNRAAELAGFLGSAGDAGRTRSEVIAAMRGLRAAELDALVDELARHRQVSIEQEWPESGRGRPRLRYRWTGRASTDPMTALLDRYEDYKNP